MGAIGVVRSDQASDLQFLIDSTPSLIHTGRPDGYLDFFNQTWLRYIGRPLEDLEGWKWTAFIHPEDLEGIVEKWRASLASGEPFLHEARVRRADGVYRWMLHHKVAMRDGRGQVVKWYGSSIDIEDRKRAEARLRQGAEEFQRSELPFAEGERFVHMRTGLHVPGAPQDYPWLEAQLQATLNVIPAYTWYALPSGGLTFLNERHADYLGLPKDHPLRFGIDVGAEWDSHIPLLHPDDHAEMRRAWSHSLRTGSPGEVSFRARNAEGGYRWFLSRVEPLRISDGTLLYWIGITIDIDERTRAEEALRTSKAYLAEAQRLSQTGSWAWNPDTDTRYWSEECYRILGFDPRDGLPGTEALIQRIHPDDQPAFRESTRRARYNKLDEGVNYRIVHPGGAVRDIYSIGHPVFSPGGDLIEYTGTVIDVTERKAAEEKIRAQEMELRQMLDLAPQQVGVFGSDGERLFANRMALDYIGLSLEEWRQRPGNVFCPGEFVHPDDRERAARAFSESTRSSASSYELEFRVRGADGNYRWFLARFNPLHDDKGEVKRWYVASTDIDERKRAEEKLQQENVALREEIDKASMFEEIVGSSRPLKAVLSRIDRVAPTDSTVLITGETGTGKELIARAVHKRSQRSRRPFVSVNCAALPPTLVTSELFGHEKGAFTGATQRRIGRFEMADGGTIFLDEVGELLPDMQAALLRVLQEREFERVGGGHPIKVDVRVIAATNRDLGAAVEDRLFRQDLLYRLNVFPIEVPPLRERKDDVLVLVEYFVQRYANRAGKNIRSIDQKTLDLLQAYDWPGNIRELQNVIERSIILSTADVFSVDELWLSKKTSPQASRVETSPALNVEPPSERELIEATLAETRGRVSGSSGAAAKLRVPASTLESRIKALKINKQQFKFS
jgi:PAS domain S-box-containing protein